MQRRSGFTLIEVMVTVAIVAILAAVALPMYNDYVRRGKIAEATSALLALKTKMEQFYLDNRSYKPGGAIVDPCQPTSAVPLPPLKYFTPSCPVLSDTTYTIQAAGGVAGGDQTLAGITFTIDQSNNRATTVTSGSAMANAGYIGNLNCWVSKKGGVC
jgi:type IV pilus assembly protein PilE